VLGVNATPSGNEFIVNFPQTPGTKRQLPAIAPGLHRVPMVACPSTGNIVIAWRARSPSPCSFTCTASEAKQSGAEATTGLLRRKRSSQ
jgi:hypothetical protein